VTQPSFSRQVFKAYDIRGTVPDQLNTDFSYHLGLAIAQQARKSGIKSFVIGYDGRLSSNELSQALHNGLLEGGINTVDLGAVPTPCVYFAASNEEDASGIVITGSHNPENYNGFKIMMRGKTLYGDDIQELASIMRNLELTDGINPGTPSKKDIIEDYIDNIKNIIKPSRPMRIAIDCGNGIGGLVAPILYEALGCEVEKLYCEIDGNFPNHHPDPADPNNLIPLIQYINNSNCELGLAFDGDADRLGVVTKSGNIIWPDRQLILFARDILARAPDSSIIFDVKCSRHVASEIQKLGGTSIMWKTGHSLIKAKMAETGALLAGEMSGHIFFKDRWLGFDDGLYAGARLLELLSVYDNPSEHLDALPQDISTPEIKLEIENSHSIVEKLKIEGRFPFATKLITIDGVRAEYKDGFGLARASNTTPVIVLRFEATSKEHLDYIRNHFKKEIERISGEENLAF